MEREGFFSGYCRCLDGARTVAVEAEGKTLLEADCNYENCPYATDCPIAENIRQFLLNPKT